MSKIRGGETGSSRATIISEAAGGASCRVGGGVCALLVRSFGRHLALPAQ